MPLPAPRPSYALAAVGVAATIWLLVEARPVLEPLVISVLLWFLLTALARVIAWGMHGRGAEPGLLAHLLSALIAIGAIVGLSVMVSVSLAGFRENLPTYEANLRAMAQEVANALGIGGTLDLSSLVGDVNMGNIALSVAGSAVGFVSSLVVVLVYVIFIYAEGAGAGEKLKALAPDGERFAAVSDTISRIRRDIETYLGVKCVVGLAQAVPTFAILAAMGVDGAAFWSVIIFVSSFVPTVGSLIGIVFPALVTLAQFGSLPVFLLVTGLLAVVQLAGSNWLEPKMMGSSLNLSPLVILIAIFAGGALWGITGALVAVPALAVAVIVFSRLDSMRAVAVLLSADGKV
ncbi:AI-2E family transporter [Paralimibaculum aggregatum]|uniref:AI-2E family transporter n=1 Tax=Paralimibaculum aggregatum TaxID=3036245 RepID=A0ABQ6LCU9_9RHOB|nr:AI-2E family transporter [Limibaculum sp. NKW23]GMG81195.1 AI-2E family transporter [Limibaculum sp. NKW23]